MTDDWTPEDLGDKLYYWWKAPAFGPLGSTRTPPPMPKLCMSCHSRFAHPQSSTGRCDTCIGSTPVNNPPPPPPPHPPWQAAGTAPNISQKMHADCVIMPFSSRCCEKGSYGCDINHTLLEDARAQHPAVMVTSTGMPGFTQAQIDKMLEELKGAPTPAAAPKAEKPQKPIHEMTLADYRKGVDSWWDKRRKS